MAHSGSTQDPSRPPLTPLWQPSPSDDWRTAKRADFLAMARIKRTVRLGLKSLWLHRLRSLLTVLGIVFGVCSVIAMLAIGEGLSFEAQEQIRRLGSNNILVRSIKPPEDRSATTERSMAIEYGLTYEDLGRIQSTIPSVQAVVPNRLVRQDVWYQDRRVDCEVVGTLPTYPAMTQQEVVRGRFFTQRELEDVVNVCVLEEGMAPELFPIDNPIGQTVKVSDDYYRVVGIVEPKAAGQPGAGPGAGATSTGGSQAAAYRMYVPLSSARERFGELLVKRSSGSIQAERVELHEITVRVSNLDEVLETGRIIEDVLLRYHDKKDYEITVPLYLLQQAERQKRIFNVVLGAIAAISLLVGGIGIMNIMLASVTERTREIGIRRALGAKRRDIIMQFLVETVLLSATGGVIGVALGLLIPLFVERFAEMKTIVTPWSPLVAFTISALVGVVFGLYPALRAADMDPVEALRHE